jgi:ADP-heptose:LPS heptosyltransferase
MKPVVICMGKIGDILSVIAMMQEKGIEDLVVSEKYAQIASNVPGIRQHIYFGDWQDLAGAIKWAKKQFPKVLVPQTFGINFPILHKARSFQKDQELRLA